ncbi:hypothetical protein [Microbispora sp. NPDC046933]|uniref:hypothetical protein n=1 Tax=Microbispora sp. NPDC046933 TaxID=3155618 RepID=UPI0034110A35
MNRVDRIVAAIDPAAAAAEPVVSRGVRELLGEIVATAPEQPPLWKRVLPSKRRRRVTTVVAATAALAAAAAIGVGLPAGGPLTRYANAAMSVERTGGAFSVTVLDPTADRRRFEDAFRAVGLDVRVVMIPVPPDEVGVLFGPVVPEGFRRHGTMGIRRTTPCASAFCGTVWMPTDFPGRVVFGVGRAAGPGEPYAEVDAFDPAGEEALSDYSFRGRTVAASRAELIRRGLGVGYRLVWTYPDGGFADEPVPADRVGDDWVVSGSRMHSSDVVDLYVTPGPGAGPAPEPAEIERSQPHWHDIQ